MFVLFGLRRFLIADCVIRNDVVMACGAVVVGAAGESPMMCASRVAPPALGVSFRIFSRPLRTGRPSCRRSGAGATMGNSSLVGAEVVRKSCPGSCNWRASCCNWIQGKRVESHKNCRLDFGSGLCSVGVATISNRARFCRLEMGGFVTCVAWVVFVSARALVV
jgi:hypothetical protein